MLNLLRCFGIWFCCQQSYCSLVPWTLRVCAPRAPFGRLSAGMPGGSGGARAAAAASRRLMPPLSSSEKAVLLLERQLLCQSIPLNPDLGA